MFVFYIVWTLLALLKACQILNKLVELCGRALHFCMQIFSLGVRTAPIGHNLLSDIAFLFGIRINKPYGAFQPIKYANPLLRVRATFKYLLASNSVIPGTLFKMILSQMKVRM